MKKLLLSLLVVITPIWATITFLMQLMSGSVIALIPLAGMVVINVGLIGMMRWCYRNRSEIGIMINIANNVLYVIQKAQDRDLRKVNAAFKLLQMDPEKFRKKF